MNTVLYIDDSYCLSLEQLRAFFSTELIPETSLYEDLLVAQRDGELVRWLLESDSVEENELARSLNSLLSDTPNSELINKMKSLFIGGVQVIKKPHFSSFIELQQIRCMANNSPIDLVENTPNKYEVTLMRVKNRKCELRFLLDFKIVRSDNEIFEINFLGTHSFSLLGRNIGQIATIEVPFSFSMGGLYDLSIDNEIIASVLLKDTESVIKVNNIEIEMVYVEGGKFVMGGTIEQGDDANLDELPTHEVTISDFFIGKYEVTQDLWQEVMGNNPSPPYAIGAKRPVVNVSWEDCLKFLDVLNRLTGKSFRLPTEAEWEYAARGGCSYKYAGGDNVDDVAWFDNNSGGHSHDVGQKYPNELNLYDMSGNVREWCYDSYVEYTKQNVVNPIANLNSTYKVVRGGCYNFNYWNCRVSRRGCASTIVKSSSIGFRLAI